MREEIRTVLIMMNGTKSFFDTWKQGWMKRTKERLRRQRADSSRQHTAATSTKLQESVIYNQKNHTPIF